MKAPAHITAARPAGFCLFVVLCLFVLPLLNACRESPEAKPTLESLSGELGVSFKGGRDYLVEKNLQRNKEKEGYWTIEARRETRVIKIEVVRGVDARSAHSYISERKRVLRSVFQSTPSPYPGVISHAVAMPKEYAPKVIAVNVDGQSSEVDLLPSNSRLVYGAKGEDSIRHRGGVFFHYSRSRGDVYRIDLFVPKEEYREEDVSGFFGSMRFRNPGGSTDTPDEGPVPDNAAGRISGGKTSSRDRTTESAQGGRNLIIVGFEPLGARHISAYGYSRRTTPNLDRFARDSTLFLNAVSPSSWTLPAFMSWFTSLYPSQHTLTNKYRISTMVESDSAELSRLPEGIVTLAQFLKKNGFQTAGFTGGAALSGDFGYGRGFDRYFDKATFGGFDLTIPKAVQWLRTHGNKRFFLFLQGFDVHGRFSLRVGAERKYYPGVYKGRYSGSVEEYWELRNANLDKADVRLSGEDIDFWKARYDAAIFEADRRFGEFIEKISGLGLLENSVILVSSGSGNEYFEHGGIDHGLTLYDELVLVPLLIRVPGTKGRVVRDQVRTLDIMPTALDLLGIAPDDKLASQMQGVSLVPAIKGQSLKLDAFMETDYLAQSFIRSIRTSDGWKFIYTVETGTRELYDLNRDPAERENLIEKEKILSYRLEQSLMAHLGQFKAPPH